MNSITGQDKKVHEIFSKENKFNIPEYQRPYSWGVDQCDELLGDLIGFQKEEESDDYFLGSIVVAKSPGDNFTFDVVDGQQRLTTLTILLSVISHCLRGEEGEGAFEKYIAPSDVSLNIPPQPKLYLRKNDRDFFKKFIQDPGGIEGIRSVKESSLKDSQFNIYKNARFFLTRLEGMSSKEILEFGRFVVARCVVVFVTTQGIETAYRIFSVMNDRGLDLQACDLLKAEIISKIENSEERTDYNEMWEEMEERLGRDSFNSLFPYVRMIKAKSKARRSTVEEFRREVVKGCDPKSVVNDILLPYSEALTIISHQCYQDGGTEEEKKINQLLTWLGRLNNSDWVPVAMELVRIFESDPKILLSHLEKLERLAAAILIRGSYVNSRIKRYSRVLAAIEAREDLLQAGSALDIAEETQLEVLKYLNGDIYWYAGPIKSYVILRLDSFLSGEGVDYEHSVTTFEHVLPQNPKNESVWNKDWSEEERVKWTHRLGNLVLLSRKKNPQASNHDFKKKKEVYFKTDKGVSPYACTTQVLNHENWTPKEVQERQKDILKVLASNWSLKGLELVEV